MAKTQTDGLKFTFLLILRGKDTKEKRVKAKKLKRLINEKKL
ncbi:hypothetical protein HMPREF1141_2154 [Clostridium sp. MSTE9]|nr:hypothetical protein HMPREF1141_2154 [Clostridium sp. MSTE9]